MVFGDNNHFCINCLIHWRVIMATANSKSENDTENSSIKKKCCNKIKNFFTKEVKEGQRTFNWKFIVLIIVVILVIVWLI